MLLVFLGQGQGPDTTLETASSLEWGWKKKQDASFL